LEISPDSIESIVQDILSQRRIPVSTYRVQFNPAAFKFEDALEIVDYLHELGISDLYASPLFKSRPGSTHGYDVVDYNRLNPALGTQAEFDALAQALRGREMGLLLDIVPNHMGIGTENIWWMDVLENGPMSPYAQFFDIDWVRSERVRNQVLLPILGDHYGRVLEAGELRVDYANSRFSLHYYDTRFPVNIGTCDHLLEVCYEELPFDEMDEIKQELASIITAIKNLPDYRQLDRQQERLREQTIIRRRFETLYNEHPEVGAALERAITFINGVKGAPDSFEPLASLIRRQPYRLAYWRTAADEINYRRFFDVNELASVRNEVPAVFQQTHRLIFQLAAEGKVTGLRVDHPDGMWNPPGYFMQLQEGYTEARASRYDIPAELCSAVVGSLATRLHNPILLKNYYPIFVLVEKILSEIEPLPNDWSVYGTTGYDFMIAVNGIFVNRDHVHAFDRLYSNFIGHHFDFRELIYETKKQIMTHSLASELHSRSLMLTRIVTRNRRFQGFTLNSLTGALTEFIACLSIYRTYITGPGTVSDRDRFYIEEAIDEAIRRNPRSPRSIFEFLRDTLLLQNIYEFPEHERGNLIEFLMKFQQITGPVMAKSVEDTTFYIYNRLVSLNEVGGNPEQFGIGVDDFHKHNAWHREHWQHTMTSLSTHDTKRSEDVRARLNVLSEIPGEWEAAVWRWREMNVSAKTMIDHTAAPDANDEYLLYQTLVGALPFGFDPKDGAAHQEFEERIVQYMQKAINEAKVHTSWINPNEPYNTAMQQFITTILSNPAFMNDLTIFQRRVSFFGQFNALSQTLLKFVSPGIPDTYQGSELWDFSLVDPDNRRPVDYTLRRYGLRSIQERMARDRKGLTQELLRDSANGYIKLYITHLALKCRRENPEMFAEGDYAPVETAGAKAGHVCAFTRSLNGESILCAVPVLVVGLTEGVERTPTGGEVWRDTRLMTGKAGDRYRNLFTDEEVTVKTEQGTTGLWAAEVFEQFPVALLEKVEN
jgi:(1->4)-alpha-D-glucan 1-alpha-D-glucosylmutase